MESGRAKAKVFNKDKTYRYPSYVQDIMGPMCFDYGFGPFRWICMSNKKADLKKIINKNNDPEKDSLIDCCLYLGKKATNTKSNAIEVINWMSINNLNSAILVTSNIHMPRSILEFQNNANHIRIAPWPVSSDSLNWQNFLMEYLRFSIIRIRYLIL